MGEAAYYSLSPCIASAGQPSMRRYLVISSATSFVPTKINALADILYDSSISTFLSKIWIVSFLNVVSFESLEE